MINKYSMVNSRNKGGSLIELIVTASIIIFLASLTMVGAMKARGKAKQVVNINHQRQIVLALNNYTMDHEGEYPPSVATIGTGESWHWQQPTMLASHKSRGKGYRRSMATYIGSYLEYPSLLFCPNAPREPHWFKDFFKAGEDWNNPETAFEDDPAFGSYCFYFNYKGFLPETSEVFIGPGQSNLPGDKSKLLVSDYLGYGHWRSGLFSGGEKVFTSCEKFKNSSVVQGTRVSSDFWAKRDSSTEKLENMKISLHGGFTDGHVERYAPWETVEMNVSIAKEGNVGYPGYLSAGTFYIPEKAIKGTR